MESYFCLGFDNLLAQTGAQANIANRVASSDSIGNAYSLCGVGNSCHGRVYTLPSFTPIFEAGMVGMPSKVLRSK